MGKRYINTASGNISLFNILLNTKTHSLYKHALKLAGYLFLIVFLFNNAFADSEYRIDTYHGGNWHDAEKSKMNKNDDWLCWASSAANILVWTNWASKTDFTDADKVFLYFSDHWTDDPSGSPREAWRWWFSGKNNAKKGAKVIKEGGAFWPEIMFPEKKWGQPPGSIFRGIGQNQLQRDPHILRKLLLEGYGVVLQIISQLPDGTRDSHMITLWGFRHSMTDPFKGIFITDSDDAKDNNSAQQAGNSLRYYSLKFRDKFWWIKYRHKEWKILAAYALLKKSIYDNQ